MADTTTPPTPETPPQSGIKTLSEKLRQWPLSRKLALIAVALISLGLFAIIIFQARQAEYQTLYTNLAQSDAAAVVDWLKRNNVRYILKNNGSNIQIPAPLVHETRLSLASAGLPQGGGVGFEIFDKQSFALTDFVQKVNYTRALQGELSRTISSLGPVENARVHLAIPEKRLFKNQQKAATASVIVKLSNGRTLTDSQVQGIIHLVSGSVQNLSPKNITIIDQNGNVLSPSKSKGLIGKLTPDMLEFQLKVERHLEIRAQSLLDTALGPNNSMARVTALLDFSQVEKTEELYDPEEPVIRSEQLSEEQATSETSGGVPGVETNLQGGGGQGGASGPNSNRSQRTTNYEISRTISKIVNPIGSIKKISVAVLVSDKMTEDEDSGEKTFQPRDNNELTTIKNMIKGALALDFARGDQIEVLSMPFTYSAKQAEVVEAPPFNVYEFLPLARYALLFGAGLLLYFLMIRPIIKTLRQEVTPHMKTVEELE
ncbi:MAG: flagellar basal-body MS-ring/collar protein FliF, partial [Desulfobulbaceae bacterium]|nr:flagellar basal-body MS-ring/collar protein FliF [Desulfobulbaceae bacterium]